MKKIIQEEAPNLNNFNILSLRKRHWKTPIGSFLSGARCVYQTLIFPQIQCLYLAELR